MPNEFSGDANLWQDLDVPDNTTIVSDPVNVGARTQGPQSIQIGLKAKVSGALRIEVGFVKANAQDPVMPPHLQPSTTIGAKPTIEWMVKTDNIVISANTPYYNTLTDKVDYVRLAFTALGGWPLDDALTAYVRC